MGSVIEVTDKTFDDEVIKSELPAEVDFWAPWCFPCQMVSPVYDKLAREYEGEFKFCKINVDENGLVVSKYQIMSIPMQYFFVNGENVEEMLGAVSEHVTRNTIAAILKRNGKEEKDKG